MYLLLDASVLGTELSVHISLNHLDTSWIASSILILDVSCSLITGSSAMLLPSL